MIEKVILSIAEYFRVFQIICSIFIALAVSFTIERFLWYADSGTGSFCSLDAVGS